jgi:hypothetical protein
MPAPVYATLQQLADKLNKDSVDDLPTNAGERLRMASRKVDELLIGAVYDTDDNGVATDSDKATAITNATLAQVVYWYAGYSTEHGAPLYTNVSIGSVTLGARSSNSAKSDAPEYAPLAITELRQEGLLNISAKVYG